MVLKGITLEQLEDRSRLLGSLDRFHRAADAGGQMQGLDDFQKQAMSVLTSSKLAEAMDLSREDPETLKRYGNDGRTGDGPTSPKHMLLARRLVEAGARCVTLSFGLWDWHDYNFSGAREFMPQYDQAVSALLEDLHSRGLEKDVTVLAWGEFGRSPRINNKGGEGGRDHWPNVSCAMLAGGGMRTGQVIGSTNRLAEEAKDRPVHFQDVFATLYHNLGIDVRKVKLPDLTGRPQYLIDNSQYGLIRELI